MVAAALILLCCCVMGCLYYRRRKKTVDDAELSPYEKWIRNEEIKQNGGAPVQFANSSDHATFNTTGKDGERLNKLHTKHGVTMDARKSLRVGVENPMQRGSVAAMDEIYNRQSGSQLQGTWAEQEYGEFANSQHNPMNASQRGPLDAAQVEAELGAEDIYEEPAAADQVFEEHTGYEETYDNGYYDDEGNWVEYSAEDYPEFATEEQRQTFAEEVEADNDPFGGEEEGAVPPPPSRGAPTRAAPAAPGGLAAPEYEQKQPENYVGEYERGAWKQQIDGNVKDQYRNNYYGQGTVTETEISDGAGVGYDIYRKVNLYPKQMKKKPSDRNPDNC
jgi:hypothetical protein